jgi:hypothetical protein
MVAPKSGTSVYIELEYSYEVELDTRAIPAERLQYPASQRRGSDYAGRFLGQSWGCGENDSNGDMPISSAKC